MCFVKEDREKILATYVDREPVDYHAALVDNRQIAENDYNLSVSSYVEPEDTTEQVDIVALNSQIAQIVAHQSELRTQIDAIVAELEAADDALPSPDALHERPGR